MADTTHNSTTTPDGAPTAPGFVSQANLISRLTLVSRVFGLLRDKACSYFLGVGTEWSAFWMGFQVPNLFRRIFGEGALTAVFLPVYRDVQQKHGEATAAKLAQAVLTSLVLILGSLIAIGELFLVPAALNPHVLPANRLALAMIAIMLPYALFVCVVALAGAICANHHRFAAQAASPIILNILMCSAAAVPAWVLSAREPLHLRLYWLAGAVLLAGLVQMTAMMPSMIASGIRPRWVLTTAIPGFGAILRNMLPMIAGMSVVQLNTFMASQIAWWLSPDGHGGHTTFSFLHWTVHLPMLAGALGKLSVAQRIYLLPVGVFGVATATAIFPRLAAAAAQRDQAAMKQLLQTAMRKSLFLSVPTTAGMLLIAPLLITSIYFGGRVSAADIERAVWATRWFCMGIWAFELQMILLRAFYAMQDARTPLKIAVSMVALNFSLNLTLVWFMQEGGLAASTSICAIVQCLLLLLILRRRIGRLGLSSMVTLIARCVAATAVMIFFAGSLDYGLATMAWFGPQHRLLGAIVRLPVVLAVAAGVYGLMARWLNIAELRTAPVLRRFAKLAPHTGV